MKREYYSDSISGFLKTSPQAILGELASNTEFSVEQTQRDAWIEEINILQKSLSAFHGQIYFEYSVPRMGQRIDVLILIGPVIFVLEFKIGAQAFHAHSIEQVWDYALDLKNFHESSYTHFVAPVLVATHAQFSSCEIATTPQNDKLLFPIKSTGDSIAEIIKGVLSFADGEDIDHFQWERGRYCPTPTIIEAAMALYNNHSVDAITRNDASAINLSKTCKVISDIIIESKENLQKSICFVTGVPGSGKTLVGLNIATKRIDRSYGLYSVFLSGNGPLVRILREALVRDKVQREKQRGRKIKKGEAFSEVKAFIQNVHHFRDDCLVDLQSPPVEHVAIFDEAQRAWNLERTSSFMLQKKKQAGFTLSEPEFLISCLDRHKDWAAIICLVGGGQEIHTGEAGIGEWIDSINKSYPNWHVYLSSRLIDSEYGAGRILDKMESRSNVIYKDALHLSVSLRSFRAENVSLLVKQLLDIDVEGAQKTLRKICRYPIVITRDLSKAKLWLKEQARGSERYGMVVSSHAERLKPHAIDVRSPMDPIHSFLEGKDDVRSSYYLEDVATEFKIQGLELDWVCVTWDADFRYADEGWEHRSFRGKRWTRIRKEERKTYLKNAYRVLLTRARQGMVIVVPSGDPTDSTRQPHFYDSTYEYLKRIGFSEL